MTLSQTYPIKVDGSRQMAVITALKDGRWECYCTYKWFDEKADKKEFPFMMKLGSKSDADAAGSAWARGDTYAEVSKRWRPTILKGEDI